MKKTFSLNGINFLIEYPEEIDNLAEFFCPDLPTDDAPFSVKSKISIVSEISLPIKSRIFSKSIYQSKEETVYLFNSNLAIHLTKANKQNISALIEVKKINANSLARIKRAIYRQSDHMISNIYVQALRHAVLYPYFVLMNQKEGASLSHGTAFSFGDNCFVLIGFDGVGKSTISELVRKKSGDILTDNFVILDDKFVYFVPDPLRIIDQSRSHYYGKRFEKIDFKCTKSKITSVIFSFLGPDYYFKESTTYDINKLNSQFLNYLPEFYDFGRYSSVLNLLNTSISFMEYPLNTENYKFYECQRSMLSDNARMINDILSI